MSMRSKAWSNDVQANYEYVVAKIAELAEEGGSTVLDYGCGKGDIVVASRERGFETYGVEKFYGGSDIRDTVAGRGLLGNVVREIGDDGRIPFDDDAFDLVVSNQVFEHIPELAAAIAEIARVLKPGGTLLCLFPSKGTVREVHCGIPIVHWLPKRTRARYYWLLTWRALGFGAHKAGKTRRQWAADFHEWLNNYTHYRSMRQLRNIFSTFFEDFQPLEDDYLRFRLQRRGLGVVARVAGQPVARSLSRTLVRLYGGRVMRANCRKWEK